MPTSNPVSFRLSAEAIAIIGRLERRLGLKRSAVVELALRTLDGPGVAEAGKKPEKKSRKGA